MREELLPPRAGANIEHMRSAMRPVSRTARHGTARRCLQSERHGHSSGSTRTPLGYHSYFTRRLHFVKVTESFILRLERIFSTSSSFLAVMLSRFLSFFLLSRIQVWYWLERLIERGRLRDQDINVSLVLKCVKVLTIICSLKIVTETFILDNNRSTFVYWFI